MFTFTTTLGTANIFSKSHVVSYNWNLLLNCEKTTNIQQLFFSKQNINTSFIPVELNKTAQRKTRICGFWPSKTSLKQKSNNKYYWIQNEPYTYATYLFLQRPSLKELRLVLWRNSDKWIGIISPFTADSVMWPETLHTRLGKAKSCVRHKDGLRQIKTSTCMGKFRWHKTIQFM